MSDQNTCVHTQIYEYRRVLDLSLTEYILYKCINCGRLMAVHEMYADL